METNTTTRNNFFEEVEKQPALIDRLIAQTNGLEFVQYTFLRKLRKHKYTPRKLAVYTAHYLGYAGRKPLTPEARAILNNAKIAAIEKDGEVTHVGYFKKEEGQNKFFPVQK
jgi:hypothetical protein